MISSRANRHERESHAARTISRSLTINGGGQHAVKLRKSYGTVVGKLRKSALMSTTTHFVGEDFPEKSTYKS